MIYMSFPTYNIKYTVRLVPQAGEVRNHSFFLESKDDYIQE